MSVIENFAVLPAKDQIDFATKLLEKINAERMFITDNKFELDGVEPDDLTGGLTLLVSLVNPVEVPRKATWTCADVEDIEDDPGYDADYEDYLFEDAKKAFKTLSTVIDGYTVELDIADANEDSTAEVKAEHISHEDAGIGRYEYWGEIGHDSHPYVKVEGPIVKYCECALAFFIEPAAAEN